MDKEVVAEAIADSLVGYAYRVRGTFRSTTTAPTSTPASSRSRMTTRRCRPCRASRRWANERRRTGRPRGRSPRVRRRVRRRLPLVLRERRGARPELRRHPDRRAREPAVRRGRARGRARERRDASRAGRRPIRRVRHLRRPVPARGADVSRTRRAAGVRRAHGQGTHLRAGGLRSGVHFGSPRASTRSTPTPAIGGSSPPRRPLSTDSPSSRRPSTRSSAARNSA